jgi:hypothetical protein
MPKTDSTTIDEAFEREKWQSDLRLRERELALKEKEQGLKYLELRLKRKDERRSQWTHPLVLAVLAATLAATGNAVVAYINGVEQRELEKTRAEAQLSLEQHRDQSSQAIEETKAEAMRILEVIKTNGVDSARKNLEFLIEAGLITNVKRRADLQIYLGKLTPGEGPTLPSSTTLFEGLGLNPDQIRAALDILVNQYGTPILPNRNAPK